MLRLPAPGDEVPPLVMPARKELEPEIIETEEYEEDDEIPAASGDARFIAILAGGALALLGVFWWWLKPDPQASMQAAATPDQQASPADAEKPVEAEPANQTLIMQVEAVAKAFLEAADPAEALEQVRNPGQTEGRMKQFQGDASYQAAGFRGIVGDVLTASTRDEQVYTVQVRTDNYDLRDMALVREGGQFKVDWDSWVGWSEMPWDDFKEDKPTEPKLFRVVLSQVDYYNFGFKDDLEWSSYRLDSPDGSRTLYGYVPRTGELDQQIRPVEAGKKQKLLLKLRFPRDSRSDNQVIIDSVAGDSWVEPGEGN